MSSAPDPVEADRRAPGVRRDLIPGRRVDSAPMTDTTIAKPAGSAAADSPTFRNFIAGEWCDSTGGATFESRNPADTRDVIGRFQQGTAADAAMAIRAAADAGAMWRRTPAPKR